MQQPADRSSSLGDSAVPVKRWRHRNRLLSVLAIIALPVLFVLTVTNWRYRFEFQEGRGIELPQSKKDLKNWTLKNPSRISISREDKEAVLEIRNAGEQDLAYAVYRLPDMEGIRYIRVYAEMRCLGEHDDAAWKRARIHLIGYDREGKPLYQYPHQLGMLQDVDVWQKEDSVFKVPGEAEYYDLQIVNLKTTLLQVKRLKVLAARERDGVFSYRNVSLGLAVCWVLVVALVARAYGGARKWWRALLVAVVLVIGFQMIVYPAIKRPVRPPLSKRFHHWESFQWQGSSGLEQEVKTKEQMKAQPKPVVTKRRTYSMGWLRENFSGAHVILYAVLALAVCTLAWSSKAAWMPGVIALLQEGRQTWIDHNTDWGDLNDLAMDALGIVLGVLAYLAFRYVVCKKGKRLLKQMWKEQV